MLGLAVAELVRDVGRPGRDANREVGEQRGDEVGARVRRLRDEAEAVRREADASLRTTSTAAAATETSAERRCGLI